MDYQTRQQHIRTALQEQNLGALLVTHLPNIRYLSGFTGSAGALLLSPQRTLFFTDGRYTTQARDEVQGAQIVISKKGPLPAVAEFLTNQAKHAKTTERIGFEAEYVTTAIFSQLLKALPKKVRLRPSPPLLGKARMVKDRDEISLVRAAALAGSKLFDTILKVICPGMAELDVAAELEYAASKAGAEAMSFPTIIAAGKRSALPHGRASRQPVPRSGFVVCDFGVILAGYCSDMTRTVFMGRVPQAARDVYSAVREAQLAAIASVQPGRTVGEVDQAARKLLQQRKLGRYFIHSTGHGVGLEIHEPPRIAAGQKEILRPGMVITIEPGVYIPGKWGVRIEDMVLVTESGGEVLTPASKELIAV
jgi:Xaa-Pro aminopeptidase